MTGRQKEGSIRLVRGRSIGSAHVSFNDVLPLGTAFFWQFAWQFFALCECEIDRRSHDFAVFIFHFRPAILEIV
jgi:hypothetical protein